MSRARCVGVPILSSPRIVPPGCSLLIVRIVEVTGVSLPLELVIMLRVGLIVGLRGMPRDKSWLETETEILVLILELILIMKFECIVYRLAYCSGIINDVYCIVQE